ncbi:hypothetical protein [Plantactinospora sp. KBS50]|uniref:DUF4190 domain-containing protein n=1 Tax=Plantactinospora sp. KBS50 TaxID=2024580 RepID=UPI00351583E6
MTTSLFDEGADMQPGYPGQDPYGQQPQDPTAPQYQDPYAQPPAPQPPYGQPAHGQQPTSGQPYGQPTSGQPYGQPTSGQPYGQPTSGQPYGQPTSGQPYGQQPYGAGQYPDPYGQQPGQPYGAAPGQPGFGQPGQAPNNTLGLLSMIFGIAGIPLVCCLYIGIASGIAGIVLGYLGKQKAEQGLATNRSQALTGMICGAAAVALGILAIIGRVALGRNGVLS